MAAQEEYFYGRIRFSPRVLENTLRGLDGNPVQVNEDGSFELIFKKFANNHPDAREILVPIRDMIYTLRAVHDDLERFIDEFEFIEQASVVE